VPELLHLAGELVACLVGGVQVVAELLHGDEHPGEYGYAEGGGEGEP
jgi:hypothetical protein